MEIVTAVLRSLGNLGNSGAITNAARACGDRIEASAAVESALRHIAPRPQPAMRSRAS